MATKKQLTTFDGRILLSHRLCTRIPGILYSADKGGNEIDHIYLLEDKARPPT